MHSFTNMPAPHCSWLFLFTIVTAHDKVSQSCTSPKRMYMSEKVFTCVHEIHILKQTPNATRIWRTSFGLIYFSLIKLFDNNYNLTTLEKKVCHARTSTGLLGENRKSCCTCNWLLYMVTTYALQLSVGCR